MQYEDAQFTSEDEDDVDPDPSPENAYECFFIAVTCLEMILRLYSFLILCLKLFRDLADH